MSSINGGDMRIVRMTVVLAFILGNFYTVGLVDGICSAVIRSEHAIEDASCAVYSIDGGSMRLILANSLDLDLLVGDAVTVSVVGGLWVAVVHI